MTHKTKIRENRLLPEIMKAVLISLIFVLSPTAALSNTLRPLDTHTQEILEKRTCQHLKSGLTLGETVNAIKYAVEQNNSRDPSSTLQREVNDIINKARTEMIVKNALKNRCPEFLPRN